MKKMSVTDVELLGDLFFGPATVLGGSWLDDGALKQAATESFPEKRSCVVREWMLLDVMFEDECQREMKGQGVVPTILYTQNMVFDSAQKLPERGQFRTHFATSVEGCFFETTDTIFVLAGRGSRKYASLCAISALDMAIQTQPIR
jgi:hypothetical protein